MSREWQYFGIDELEEILACMEDSDRYIVEGRKNRIMKSIQKELEARRKPDEDLLICSKHHRQYIKQLGCRDCQS